MVMTVLADDNLPGVGDALLIWESLISRKIPHHSATMQKPKLRLWMFPEDYGFGT